MEMQQLKREIYDNTEREADMKDHMKFLEDDTKSLRKKVRDLEDENDNLSTELKKISLEKAAAFKSTECSEGGDVNSAETEVELKIQFELTEKELSVLKKKMVEMEEENDMLHDEMFMLERKVKDKDQLLQIMPAPSSPNAYYEDKIKEYEKQADDFRSKLLEKEKEIEQLYGSRQSKRLRKTKSLDSDSDYNQVVDLKRQLELTQQEASVLREKIITLESDNERIAEERDKLKENKETWQPLTALAVAYVDNENEVQLRDQITEMENTNSLLTETTKRLAERFISLTSKYCSAAVHERFNTSAVFPDGSQESELCIEEVPVSGAYDEPHDFGRSYVFMGTPPPGREEIVSCDVASNQQQMQVNAQVLNSRDPVYILTFIDERLVLLEQLVGGMDAAVDKAAPRECDTQVSSGTNGSEIVNQISTTGDKKVSSAREAGNRDLLIEKILDLEEDVVCVTNEAADSTNTTK